MIKDANENIISKNLVIDPNTKEMVYISPFFNLAAYNSHYTFKNFWWGTRYYFTSNSAVNELVYKFTNYSYIIGATSAAIVAAIGSAPAGIIGAFGAAYFGRMANDLNYYNNQHLHNQIYMDLNYTGNYSFHILA